MEQEGKIQQAEQTEWYEDVTGCVANLSAAFASLSEVDAALFSKRKQAAFSRMKNLIFDSLAYYCECLTQPAEETPDE